MPEHIRHDNGGFPVSFVGVQIGCCTRSTTTEIEDAPTLIAATVAANAPVSQATA